MMACREHSADETWRKVVAILSGTVGRENYVSKKEFQKVICEELCGMKLPASPSKKTCSKDTYYSSRIGRMHLR